MKSFLCEFLVWVVLETLEENIIYITTTVK